VLKVCVFTLFSVCLYSILPIWFSIWIWFNLLSLPRVQVHRQRNVFSAFNPFLVIKDGWTAVMRPGVQWLAHGHLDLQLMGRAGIEPTTLGLQDDPLTPLSYSYLKMYCLICLGQYFLNIENTIDRPIVNPINFCNLFINVSICLKHSISVGIHLYTLYIPIRDILIVSCSFWWRTREVFLKIVAIWFMLLYDLIFSENIFHVSGEGDQHGHLLSFRGKPLHHQRNAERGSAGLPQKPSKRS